MNRLTPLRSLESWIDQQQCNWLEVTFRANGAIRPTGKAAVALRWTIDRIDQRWGCHGKLRSAMFYGGDLDAWHVEPHFQGLLEIPANADLDVFEDYARRWWARNLCKVFRRNVVSEFWCRPRTYDNPCDVRYYARYEGPTFSSGMEKVAIELLRLDAPVLSVSLPTT